MIMGAKITLESDSYQSKYGIFLYQIDVPNVRLINEIIFPEKD